MFVPIKFEIMIKWNNFKLTDIYIIMNYKSSKKGLVIDVGQSEE